MKAKSFIVEKWFKSQNFKKISEVVAKRNIFCLIQCKIQSQPSEPNHFTNCISFVCESFNNDVKATHNPMDKI